MTFGEITIVIILFLTVPSVIKYLIQQMLVRTLEVDLQMRAYAQFNNMIDRKFSKLMIPIFTRDYLKMQSATLQDDKQALKDSFDNLLNLHLAPRQRDEVLKRAFSYYASAGNGDHASALLKQIHDTKNQPLIHECDIMYSVYIKKETRYLSELEELLKHAVGSEAAAYHYMLSLEYGYLDNQQLREENLKAVSKLLEQSHLSSAL